MNMMHNLLAPSIIPFPTLIGISITLIVLMVIAAIFIIAVVLFQPGNSDGINAISGSSETFFGKNKSKTIEGRMKKLTVISVVVLALLSIAFFIVWLLP